MNMNNSTAVDYEKKYKKVIIALSVIIPLAVAALFRIKIKGFDFSFLPPIYAGINALTAILLMAALMAIKNKKVKLHENIIKICIMLSTLFLLMYVLYHITSDPTPYGGKGIIRYVYYFTLISHIALSVIIIPLVLFTYVKAWSRKFDAHRKLAKITFPLWFYVAISGVAVYLMIAPWYV
jgi:putative membrane protein